MSGEKLIGHCVCDNSDPGIGGYCKNCNAMVFNMTGMPIPCSKCTELEKELKEADKTIAIRLEKHFKLKAKVAGVVEELKGRKGQYQEVRCIADQNVALGLDLALKMLEDV